LEKQGSPEGQGRQGETTPVLAVEWNVLNIEKEGKESTAGRGWKEEKTV